MVVVNSSFSNLVSIIEPQNLWHKRSTILQEPGDEGIEGGKEELLKIRTKKKTKKSRKKQRQKLCNKILLEGSALDDHGIAAGAERFILRRNFNSILP